MTGRRLIALVLVVLAALPWVCGGERKTLSKQERSELPGSFAKMKKSRTCFELQGETPAEAVVFVHGLNSPSYVWGELPETLRKAGYLTLVYDLYGRGWSDRPWEDYDVDLFDRQLQGLMRKVGLRGKVHLVGLSMGGIISSEFTLRHRDRVASLTLIDPGGFQVELPTGSSLLTTPFVGDYLIQLVGDRLLLAGNARLVHDKTRVGDLVRKFQPQLEYAGYKRAFVSTLRHMPLSDFTARYTELGLTPIPIEVFWGKQDEVTPVSGAALAARLLPKAAVHLIDEAGHLPHYEKPDEVADLMLAFLRANAAPPQKRLQMEDDDIEQGAPAKACKECDQRRIGPQGRSGSYGGRRSRDREERE